MPVSNDVLTLIHNSITTNEYGDSVAVPTRRTVFVDVRSIGLKRKLEADEAGLKLAHKFILADELDYAGEDVCEYNGESLNIVNVFITPEHTVELTTARY